MSSLNHVQVIGNLGKDPEVRKLNNGNSVANVTVATSESWNDKATGEKQERTEWHQIVIYGKLADIVAQYLQKGSKVYFSGSLQTRKWQDKEGADRWTTEIKARDMIMLGGRNQATESPAKSGDWTQEAKKPAGQPEAVSDFDDDIPF